MVRPREDHTLHIESASLDISPGAALRWHRDVDDNSVATATFEDTSSQLTITSEVICQHYNSVPLDFIVHESAVDYPFTYEESDAIVLNPYRICSEPVSTDQLGTWAMNYWKSGESIQTLSLLINMCTGIQQSMVYQARDEEGVQSATETLSLGSGSCRDFAHLFVEATRLLGFASRFVSGYLCTPPNDADHGAMHAWAEIFIPGAGWKGFDPTQGLVTGHDHIPVAVSRHSGDIPPVAGLYYGQAEARLEIGVWVSEL